MWVGGVELFAWLILPLHARPHQIMTNDRQQPIVPESNPSSSDPHLKLNQEQQYMHLEWKRKTLLAK